MLLRSRDGEVIVVIGRLDGSGKRFAANQAEGDSATAEAVRAREPLGRRVSVRPDGKGFNRFTFAD